MEVSQLTRYDGFETIQPGIWQKIGNTIPQISLRTSAPDQAPRYLIKESELKNYGSNIQSGGYLAPYSKGFSAETIENLFDSSDIKPRITSYIFEGGQRPPESGYMLPRLEDDWKTRVATEKNLVTPKIGFYMTPDLDKNRSANATLIYGGGGRMSGSGDGSGSSRMPGNSPSGPGGGGVVETPPIGNGPLNPGQCGGGNY